MPIHDEFFFQEDKKKILLTKQRSLWLNPNGREKRTRMCLTKKKNMGEEKCVDEKSGRNYLSQLKMGHTVYLLHCVYDSDGVYSISIHRSFAAIFFCCSGGRLLLYRLQWGEDACTCERISFVYSKLKRKEETYSAKFFFELLMNLFLGHYWLRYVQKKAKPIPLKMNTLYYLWISTLSPATIFRIFSQLQILLILFSSTQLPSFKTIS